MREYVDTDDTVWNTAFNVMVHPLHQLCRAVLPQMYQRRAGKIVVFGSATGIKAQVGYVRTVGVEAAPHNVPINLIAQNFVENPAYFPPEFQATEEFKHELSRVPIGRLATARNDAFGGRVECSRSLFN